MKADENLNYVVQEVRKTLVNEMVGKVELEVKDYFFLLGCVAGAVDGSGYIVTRHDIKYQEEGWAFPQVIPEMEGLNGALQLMNMLLYLTRNETTNNLFNLVV